MKRFEVYLYQTAAGREVVGSALAAIARSSADSFSSIETGIRLLEEHGPEPGLNRFKQLRHVERDDALWELRATGKPAYRILFAPVPGEDAFVLLHVVRKDDMAKDPRRTIREALERLDDWLANV